MFNLSSCSKHLNLIKSHCHLFLNYLQISDGIILDGKEGILCVKQCRLTRH